MTTHRVSLTWGESLVPVDNHSSVTAGTAGTAGSNMTLADLASSTASSSSSSDYNNGNYNKSNYNNSNYNHSNDTTLSRKNSNSSMISSHKSPPALPLAAVSPPPSSSPSSPSIRVLKSPSRSSKNENGENGEKVYHYPRGSPSPSKKPFFQKYLKSHDVFGSPPTASKLETFARSSQPTTAVIANNSNNSNNNSNSSSNSNKSKSYSGGSSKESDDGDDSRSVTSQATNLNNHNNNDNKSPPPLIDISAIMSDNIFKSNNFIDGGILGTQDKPIAQQPIRWYFLGCALFYQLIYDSSYSETSANGTNKGGIGSSSNGPNRIKFQDIASIYNILDVLYWRAVGIINEIETSALLSQFFGKRDDLGVRNISNSSSIDNIDIDKDSGVGSPDTDFSKTGGFSRGGATSNSSNSGSSSSSSNSNSYNRNRNSTSNSTATNTAANSASSHSSSNNNNYNSNNNQFHHKRITMHQFFHLLYHKCFFEKELEIFVAILVSENNTSLNGIPLISNGPLTLPSNRVSSSSNNYISHSKQMGVVGGGISTMLSCVNNTTLSLLEDLFFIFDAEGSGLLNFDAILTLAAVLTIETAVLGIGKSNFSDEIASSLENDLSVMSLTATALQLMMNMGASVTLHHKLVKEEKYRVYGTDKNPKFFSPTSSSKRKSVVVVFNATPANTTPPPPREEFYSSIASVSSSAAPSLSPSPSSSLTNGQSKSPVSHSFNTRSNISSNRPFITLYMFKQYLIKKGINNSSLGVLIKSSRKLVNAISNNCSKFAKDIYASIFPFSSVESIDVDFSKDVVGHPRLWSRAVLTILCGDSLINELSTALLTYLLSEADHHISGKLRAFENIPSRYSGVNGSSSNNGGEGGCDDSSNEFEMELNGTIVSLIRGYQAWLSSFTLGKGVQSGISTASDVSNPFYNIFSAIIIEYKVLQSRYHAVLYDLSIHRFLAAAAPSNNKSNDNSNNGSNHNARENENVDDNNVLLGAGDALVWARIAPNIENLLVMFTPERLSCYSDSNKISSSGSSAITESSDVGSPLDYKNEDKDKDKEEDDHDHDDVTLDNKSTEISNLHVKWSTDAKSNENEVAITASTSSAVVAAANTTTANKLQPFTALTTVSTSTSNANDPKTEPRSRPLNHSRRNSSIGASSKGISLLFNHQPTDNKDSLLLTTATNSSSNDDSNDDNSSNNNLNTNTNSISNSKNNNNIDIKSSSSSKKPAETKEMLTIIKGSDRLHPNKSVAAAAASVVLVQAPPGKEEEEGGGRDDTDLVLEWKTVFDFRESVGKLKKEKEIEETYGPDAYSAIYSLTSERKSLVEEEARIVSQLALVDDSKQQLLELVKDLKSVKKRLAEIDAVRFSPSSSEVKNTSSTSNAGDNKTASRRRRTMSSSSVGPAKDGSSSAALLISDLSKSSSSAESATAAGGKRNIDNALAVEQPPSTVTELFETGQFEGRIAKDLRDTLRQMNSADANSQNLSLRRILDMVSAGNKLADDRLGEYKQPGSPISKLTSPSSSRSNNNNNNSKSNQGSPSNQKKLIFSMPPSTKAAKFRELAAKTKLAIPKSAESILPIDIRLRHPSTISPASNAADVTKSNNSRRVSNVVEASHDPNPNIIPIPRTPDKDELSNATPDSSSNDSNINNILSPPESKSENIYLRNENIDDTHEDDGDDNDVNDIEGSGIGQASGNAIDTRPETILEDDL